MESVVIVVGAACVLGYSWLIFSIMGADMWCILRKRIYLLDVWGRITDSRLGPGLGTVAYQHPFIKVGQVHLQNDGTVTGPTSYIKKWSFNKEDLI